jgi:ribose 5-phosphate isomerase B
MLIYLGADHRGFELKEKIKEFLTERAYPISDLSLATLTPDDDYPEIAKKVAEKVSIDFDRSKAILICGSGVGMCITANKYPNVRASLNFSADQAYDSRKEDDANILCLASGHTSVEEALKIITAWLQTPFSDEERHRRRLRQIEKIEAEILERGKRL